MKNFEKKLTPTKRRVVICSLAVIIAFCWVVIGVKISITWKGPDKVRAETVVDYGSGRSGECAFTSPRDCNLNGKCPDGTVCGEYIEGKNWICGCLTSPTPSKAENPYPPANPIGTPIYNSNNPAQQLSQ